MSRPPATLLLCALLAAPVLAASDPEVDFRLPAQADGDLTAAGPMWALLLFEEGARFAVGLEGGGAATNHTGLRLSPGPSTPIAPMPEQALPDAVRGGLDFQAGARASLYVAADHLTVEALHGHAEIGRTGDAGSAEAYLPGQVDSGAYRIGAHPVAGGGAWSAWRGQDGPLTVLLNATGVRVLEWHNATFTCTRVGPCPASAGMHRSEPAPGVSAVTMSYMEVRAPGGTLAGVGGATLLALGGPRFDLGVAGTLRLPAAALHGDCPRGCPPDEGRTLLAKGNLTLAGLGAHPSDPSRLRASLSGNIASAHLDESPTATFTAAEVAALGAALVALPLLVKLLMALFARSARPPALQHPKRQQLYELVRSEPGLSFRAIQRRLAWPHGTLANHMARLLDGRLLVARPYRNTVRFFENHGRYDATWGEAVLLRDEHLRGLHAWLLEHPGATQGDVLEHWAAAGWKRSTTQDRLRTLAEGGLVEQVKDGRRILYSAKRPRLDASTLVAAPEPSAVTHQ